MNLPEFSSFLCMKKRQSDVTVFLPKKQKSSELFSDLKTNSLLYCLCYLVTVIMPAQAPVF